MDDFEDEELYDDYYDQLEDDSDNGESLKDKYDKAKEYKEKIDEYKQKYDNYKNNSTNKPSSKSGKEAGKKATKDGSKQASKEAGKQASKEAGKQAAKETGKQAAKETGKQVAKEGTKIAAKEGTKYAIEAGTASTMVGIPVAVAIELADWLLKLLKLKKKLEKKADKKIEEATGVKNFSKKKKWIPILLIIGILMLLFIIPAMAMYSVSETATSELTTLVRAREEKHKKKLILFTKAEFKDLLNKNIEVEEDVAKKLADDGLTISKDDSGKYMSISYRNILKSYGNDLTNIFSPIDISNASSGMEDVLEDGESYDSLKDKDKNVAVTLKNVKKYLMAEIDNFNQGITWKKTSLNVKYLNIKGEKFTDYSDYINNSQKVVSDGNETMEDELITNMNYTIKDDNGKDSMLKMPNLKDHGVNVDTYGGENKAARTFVDMLEPYMQKWIIPYTMYIDTQDENFIDSVMKYMYHPADVSIFQFQKLIKTTDFEYYMICHKYKLTVTTVCGKNGCSTYSSKGPIYAQGSNTRDDPVGKKIVSMSSGKNSVTIVYEVTEVSTPYEIATDSSGNPLVKNIKIDRKKGKADSIPELVHLEGFYEILNREYKILPINENNGANSSTQTDLSVNTGTGIGSQTLVEEWNETLQVVKNETKKYQVSYYTEEQMANLGRDISRIEWYQDSNSMVSGGVDGASGGGISQTQQEYIDKFKEDALNDMNVSGVLASITLAQGILEGGSGTSSLAAKYNNHFGIKAGSSWTGNTVVLKTGEYDKSGNYYTISSAFRAYDSAADSFADHSRFIWNTKGHATKSGGYRYRDCTDYAKNMTYTAPDGKLTYNYRGAIQAIVDGGYCTDPSYVNKICSIIETYKLYEIDRESTWDGTAPAYATTDVLGGAGGSSSISTGGGNTLYSYDDMYFAYYQIEQWYAKTKGFLSTSTMQTIKLPEGGFAWPVKITNSNLGVKSVYNFYISGHNGIDISTGNVSYFDEDVKLNKGELVIATHSGTVTKVQPVTDENKNAYIEIKTEDGNFKTKYCYLSEIYVTEGDTVTKGKEIGRIGKTGAQSGIHSGSTELFLHYEIYYKGKNTDPLTYYNISCNGTEVKNYDELDLSSITNPKEYKYESSKTYLGNGGAVVEFAAQYLGYDLNTLQNLRGNYLNDHWCAWFASWCLRECGIDVIECSNTNYCPTIWNETKGVKHPYGDGYVPNPGDIIMFYSPDKGVYSHIAIVSKVEAGVVYWIGGNQGGNCPFGSKVTENRYDDRLKSYITY